MASNTPTFGHSDPQAFAHSTKLMLVHWSSMTFGVLVSTVRPIALLTFGNFSMKRFSIRSHGRGHQRFVHAEALKTGKTLLDLVDVRPRTPKSIEKRDTLPLLFAQEHPEHQPLDNPCPRAFKQSAVRPQRNSPFDFKRSTIHVHERSNIRSFGLKGIRPLISSARQSTTTSVQTVGRSASKVFALWFQPLDHQWSRAFKHSVVRPQRYSPFDLNRSTITKSTKAVGCSTLLIFDLSTSKVFVPLASTARQSLIHGLERSSIRPFDATDVVHSASMTFVRLASHATRPLPSVASSVPAFSFYDLRLYSL
ncbi:hypothetical protein LR48_Vigan10g147400 [Vigna angularis]|uniref:Uncharacterized protein n=1 Tax=Phaseolus angularis TaxID=3914 RepID=A0A0L9VL15_PHAAN|nr:hypothetical protein LR48_Vigan10g147400 [Vigna angularis]